MTLAIDAGPLLFQLGIGLPSLAHFWPLGVTCPGQRNAVTDVPSDASIDSNSSSARGVGCLSELPP